ncbi:VOC family protein [Actibacterium lipolyticum]|uniref:Glyoxalase-like domain protein n=1 Tax=Actibacterium lipolyticum TaxID=1524263 RepID=A0A238KPP1_9RHOB|nr:VOC family protein [Actibacterium lipolyticum]SMX44620.1 Glyoxalase-like domain protein [Actibacterium lipolyticum]
MDQTVFINLPITDMKKARAFYSAIGFAFDEHFCDEKTACVVISETIFLMIMTREKFAGFATLPVCNPKKETGVLIALSRDSRAAVDAITQAALDAGGAEPKEPKDMGFMYSRTFTDPDGNVFEPMWMDFDAAPAAPDD